MISILFQQSRSFQPGKCKFEASSNWLKFDNGFSVWWPEPTVRVTVLSTYLKLFYSIPQFKSIIARPNDSQNLPDLKHQCRFFLFFFASLYALFYFAKYLAIYIEIPNFIKLHMWLHIIKIMLIGLGFFFLISNFGTVTPP